jgi:phosphopantetheinyl transferase (holo-ACP synthase)
LAELPLVGDVVKHEPGRELVLRRRLDLNEDVFAGHHTVGGRQISKVDPEQHGLPIGPMTFTLEMMAEAASLLVPGKVPVRLKDVRLFRWLVYDDEDPHTVELVARMAEAAEGGTGGTRKVTVEVRDLGNKAQSAGDSPWTAAIGTVMLDSHYPDAPDAGPFKLTGERPVQVTIDQMYADLFHGPLFLGVQSLDRIGDEGIEARVRVLPRRELFGSTGEPQFLTDPVLLDVAMHPFAAWHLAAPNRAGRVLLPYELTNIELFGPRPGVGEVFTTRGRVEEPSSRQFNHSVEVVGRDGRLWSRFSAKYWRFYFPFGEVNFHGRKDEYLISDDWSAALPDQHGDDGPASACVYLQPPDDLLQPTMQEVMARVILSPHELREFRSLAGPDEQRARWIFERMAAKDAFRAVWHKTHGERLFPADIEIEDGTHGQPIARLRDTERTEPVPNVAVSYTENVAAALAAYTPHLGIAIEQVEPDQAESEDVPLDSDERRLLESSDLEAREAISRFRCAKVAAAVAFGSALPEGPRSLEVCRADPRTRTIYVTLCPRAATEVAHFRDGPILVHTTRDRGLVVATTFCRTMK